MHLLVEAVSANNHALVHTLLPAYNCAVDESLPLQFACCDKRYGCQKHHCP